MRTRNLLSVLTACVIVGLAGSLPVRAVDCGVDSPPASCTLSDIYNALWNRAFVSGSTDPISQAVVNSNVATATPDTFAGVIHSSYQDFLNLFSFAINKVDESKDGQALTIRFNPLRKGLNLLGLSVTVSKPAVSDVVTNAIPEAGRAAALTQLQGRLGDLDDITYAAAYSVETTTCSLTNPTQRCWGRGPGTYRDMLASVLLNNGGPTALTPAPEEILLLQALLGQTGSVGGLFEAKLPEDPVKRAAILGMLKSRAETDVQSTLATKAWFAKSGIDKLASLIDNQPQLSVTATYRDPGTYGGPKETGLSLELQFGNDNINALRRQSGGSPDNVLEGLRTRAANGVGTDKFVLTASYKQRDPYTLGQLTLDTPVTGFTPIDLKRTSELHAKLQWGMLLDAKVGNRDPRFDLSAEFEQTLDDKIRTKNRLVATATLTVPLGDQMSLPLSLNYANKPEFLTSQRQQLSAHLGLTYRLPWEAKKTP